MRFAQAVLCAVSCLIGMTLAGTAEAQQSVILKCTDSYRPVAGSAIDKAQLYPGACYYTFEAQLQDKLSNAIVFARVLRTFTVPNENQLTVFQGTPAALLTGSQVYKKGTSTRLDPTKFNVLSLAFTPDRTSGGMRGLPGISCSVQSDAKTIGKQFAARYYTSNDYNAFTEVATVATVWTCVQAPVQ